ncbi:hypothetical protein DQ04_00991070 [Trypanosoma grayi]|uniref:hypothetical protein n=1 Tax=Trypanosoma grayi TaxID=71804 RepID=UPI0004F43313|nr:hypothetical protein DQ04_00991070 [Trypanosoma grayi]KEG13463.1 hypothetical protein DQ04_00991070 [Trypanosoma grayi]
MPRVELEYRTDPAFQVATFTEARERSRDGSERAELTSYQSRETSIVPGMSTAELLDAHRKSLMSLHSVGDVDAEVDLHSITLSRRHLQPPEMYKSMLIEGMSDSLGEYNFGSACDAISVEDP